MSAAWANLPLEIRKRKQWAICKSDKIPRDLGGTPVSVVDPNTWLSFEDAANRAYELQWNIGYVLHNDDPYSVIDLDVKDSENCADPSKWTSKNLHDFYWQILREFSSYTEYSMSGKGYHVWLRGKARSGRRDGVELYSGERFIVCTGNVINNCHIVDWQEKLTIFSNEMHGRDREDDSDLPELEQEDDDQVVIDNCMRSGSGTKFNALCAGHWQSFGYPSQSEADLALFAILCAHSPSNEQCRRIFRMTELGKRDKSVKNDKYLNRTLKQVRARQRAELIVDETVDFSGLIESANRMISSPSGQVSATPFEATPPLSTSVAIAAPVPQIVKNAPEDGLDWPPGLAGRIAQFMYGAAPRPVKEVAIVSTIGMLAGICGKAYSIPLSGLNLYTILVARSAIGKEAMHSSISVLASAISGSCPHINNFLSFTDFASGPALLKEVINNPSICNVAGEWGQKLMHMAKGEESAGPLATLRKEMTNLYQKSGAHSIVGGLAYSDKDKNIASVTGVAYSMIGETTPDTFYAAVTPSMMADGFMSRFLTVEYKGERPALNKNQITIPDAALVDSMADIANRAQMMIDQGETVPVTRRQDADKILDDFESECDNNINATDDESRRQLWNRASLKALRLSALLAVADNWQLPVIRAEHANWAITLVRHGIMMMESRIDTGDVGISDGSREKKLVAILKEYVMHKPSQGYQIPDEIHERQIVTRLYLSQRIGRHAAFDNHRMGAGKALDATIDNLISNGMLMQLDKIEAYDKLKLRGKAYKILHLNY